MCKVILVFRFGPRLGLKTEDLGQAEQYWSAGDVFTWGPNKDEKCSLQAAGLTKAVSSGTLRSKEPSRKDFTRLM